MLPGPPNSLVFRRKPAPGVRSAPKSVFCPEKPANSSPLSLSPPKSPMPLLHKANRPRVWLHCSPRSNIRVSRVLQTAARLVPSSVSAPSNTMSPFPISFPPGRTSLNLQCDSLSSQTSDGTHAAIGGHFTVAGRVVHTSLPESMQHLPQESKSLCKHELALIVLREPVPAPKRPCEKVVFTALDHTGNKLILAGWMIQFGDGKVSIAKPDCFDVPVPSCTIFAFTMHRDECENPDQWTQLVSKPGKYILQQLETHPDAVYELWGRSWRTASKQVAPGVAESFRIWARIADGEVERLLRISGLTSPPVYTKTRRHVKTTRHHPPRVSRQPRDMRFASFGCQRTHLQSQRLVRLRAIWDASAAGQDEAFGSQMRLSTKRGKSSTPINHSPFRSRPITAGSCMAHHRVRKASTSTSSWVSSRSKAGPSVNRDKSGSLSLRTPFRGPISDSTNMMSFSRPLQASHQHHARSSLALGCPPSPKIRNVAKMSSSCTTRGPVPKEAKQCRPQSLRTLIGPSKTNPSRCRNSRATLQPCSQKLRACRVPCKRSSNSSKSKIRSPSNCKRTCKPRARASNRRSAHPSLSNQRPSWTRLGRCCEPRQSPVPSPHLSASLMGMRTCRIESSRATARGPLAIRRGPSDVTVSGSKGSGLLGDHAGDAADALGKRKLQNHRNRITYAINSFAKDVATKGKISQRILTMQVVFLLCREQSGEIMCQLGTSTLCGVPPLEECLINNHLQGDTGSIALGSKIGLQYRQTKPQNEPSGNPFEKTTSIRTVTRHPVRSHTCQVLYSGDDLGAAGHHEYNSSCRADATCHCTHIDHISTVPDMDDPLRANPVPFR